MNSRWKMNRLGFVNFWLYDEEDFPFEDGKLLLRGQNGSGKSITTQSFIPFILDGDRNPSRLDPFGSKDRRMEYYFLGEEGKDSATGYLFLEFKKEETHQYRTLCIGQRARKGKNMDFWGFVLLDGRRVGMDLLLYKEVGNTKIPLDRSEMKKALGEDTPFTDSPGEYKALVNKYLFGFRKPEQYEQFIQLMIKVRAPKLSKDLNPAKIYEILNDSLQTLSDEDLRVMVDAMEKMDGIQENLEQLGRAQGDVQIIRNEYRRYNQYVLGKKGQLYLEGKQEADKALGYLQAQEAQKRGLTEEQQEHEQQLRQMEQELAVKKTERNGLLDTDLEGMDRKLDEARKQRDEEQKKEQRWEERFKQSQQRLREGDEKIRQLEGNRDLQKKELWEERDELKDLQETFLWEKHEEALRTLQEENTANAAYLTGILVEQKKSISAGKNAVLKYADAEKRYDEQAQRLEECKRQVSKQVDLEEQLHIQLEHQKDALITAVFNMASNHVEWKPEKETLAAAEEKIRDYHGGKDAEGFRTVLRRDYEKKHQVLQSNLSEAEEKRKTAEQTRDELFQKIKLLQEQSEIEPERMEEVAESRRKLTKAGISFTPFYKAVEFCDQLSEEECSRLEAQLQAMGILDALVVGKNDQQRIRQEFPEFLDTMLCVDDSAIGDFDKLTVNEELEEGLREETQRILAHMTREEQAGGICLKDDGHFSQGILTGRMDKDTAASYVGTLARKRKKEQMLENLKAELEASIQTLETLLESIRSLKSRLQILDEEYDAAPGTGELDDLLQQIAACQSRLEQLSAELKKQERIAQECEKVKNDFYQKMLQICKALPYGRTIQEYEEAEITAEDYLNTWREVCRILQQLLNVREQLVSEQEKLEREEESADRAAAERRDCRTKIEQIQVSIAQYEEYLNSPEIKEKAKRLQEVKGAIAALEQKMGSVHDRLIRIESELEGIIKTETEDRRKAQEKIERERMLEQYFREELALKLVMDQGSRDLSECAKEAVKLPKEGDLAREYGAVFQALYSVYQKHNGNLVSYGTALEECFEDSEDGAAMRKRVRIVSVWNGKKLYLEEFYTILKNAIEETELLIQQKDRELFEDILSQTISQQLTDRIAESRKWVKDMSELMKNMDTSMGLTFSLDWKPQSAQNDQELDTARLEQILMLDRELLTTADIEKVAAHFRSKIRTEKLRAEESGNAVNYMDMVRDALDYRKWFAFQLSYYRPQGDKKPLTNGAFNRFSGGERAMAMYVPLFAAVNAQYQKASNADHPRIIALDEAFAGVDDKNISSMFELVEKLDFDYIMNSQVLWGCFETVHGLKIVELLRPQDSTIVTLIHYTWNGKEKVLDEQ